MPIMEGAHGMKLGQIKIQEMAFILVALFIFFALVSIIYLSIAGSRLTDSVENLREEEAQAIARKIAYYFWKKQKKDCHWYLSLGTH